MAYTLDDIHALNDELIALSKCGVPLESGLLSLQGDLPGNLARLASRLGARMQAGRSLAGALEDEGANLPPVYRAVVEAGVRGGRLPVALEQLAATSRRIAEMRSAVGLGMLYPLLLICVACVLFGGLAPIWAKQMLVGFDFHRLETNVAVRGVLESVADHGSLVSWVPPVLLALAAAWWIVTGRAVSAEPASAARWFGWVPWLGKLIRAGQRATFCEVLSLLIDQRVPLDQALPLAASASGDRQLRAACDSLSHRILQGERIPPEDPQLQPLPALAGWMLAGRGRQGDIAQALRRAAASYQSQALRLSDWLRLYFPILATLVIGAVTVLVWGICIFAPWTALLNRLGES